MPYSLLQVPFHSHAKHPFEKSSPLQEFLRRERFKSVGLFLPVIDLLGGRSWANLFFYKPFFLMNMFFNTSGYKRPFAFVEDTSIIRPHRRCRGDLLGHALYVS